MSTYREKVKYYTGKLEANPTEYNLKMLSYVTGKANEKGPDHEVSYKRLYAKKAQYKVFDKKRIDDLEDIAKIIKAASAVIAL
jgi:hypothetical protein